MKKILAILSALAIFAGALPMTMAGAATTEVTTLILEEDGMSLVNNATEYSQGTSYTEVTGESFTEWKDDAIASNGVMQELPFADYSNQYITYYPDLNAGIYKVSYYAPKIDYRAGLKFTGSDAVEYTAAKADGIGTGEFVELGNYTFTGVLGTDSVKIELNEGENGYSAYFDALKFELVEAAMPDLPATVENVGIVNSLVLEETGATVVNGVSAEGYGATLPVGTTFEELATATDANGSTYYRHNWTTDYSKSMRYYPVLNAGQYKVSIYIPINGYQASFTVKASDGTSYRPWNGTMDAGGNGPGAFVEIGTCTFTGVYGKDSIELIQREGYNTGWSVCYDAVKFERVNPLVEEAGNVETLIVEEDGTALLNGSESYVTDYAGTVVTGDGMQVKTGDGLHGNSSYMFPGANSQSKYVTYYPILNKAKYKVYIYVNSYDAYQTNLSLWGSDGLKGNASFQLGVKPTAGFREIGEFTATGVYGQDFVKITDVTQNGVHAGYGQYCDAVKFEKVADIETEPGEVNTLILEENGEALVNDASEYVKSYGSTKAIGTTFADMSKGTDGHNGGWYRHNWTGEQAKSVRYYPVLNKGKYKVSVFVPATGYQVGTIANGSDGTTVSKNNSSMDYGNAGPGEFVEYGTFTFTGVYGEDYIELTERLKPMHAGYNYNTGWCVYYDAVKFERIDDRAAAWSLENADGSENLGKYTWTVEKGESVNTAYDGFKGKGWNIERPTMDSDIDATASSGVKISIPEGLYNTTDFTINLWVRNDGTAWNQNILEIYQADKQHRWANVRLSNNVLEGHMRSKVGDSSSGTVGESVNSQTSVDTGRGEWHMVTLVIDNNTATWSSGDPNGAFIMDYFYDGVRIGRRSVDNANGQWINKLTANTFIYVGADHNGNNRFNGTIDEMTFYKGILTPEDVADLYNKEKQVESSIKDNIAMATATTLGTTNTITLAAPSVPESDTAFEASATVDGVFAGELVYVSDIPEGLYVSNVKAGEEKIVVTFAGETTEVVASNKWIRAAVMAYGENTANSNRFIATVNTVFDMAVSSITLDGGVYKVSIQNNSWDYNNTVDVVVAVYESDGTMKDAYLEKEVAPKPSGSSFSVTTDALDYAEGDMVKVFIFESVDTLKPVNAYRG